MGESYFEICHRRRAKVRWICKALKLSGFLDPDNLSDVINEKVARMVRRRGELDEDSIAQIGENLIMAKIAKRYVTRRINPYDAKPLKRSPTHRVRAEFPDIGFDFEQSRSPIFKEKNLRLKTHPSILCPGFLPDGNEAFFLLRKCFLKFGSLYYVNYQTQFFHKETIYCQLYDLIVEINNRHLKNAGAKCAPILVATSFGGHILVGFLRWLKDLGLQDTVDIKGVVIISPVLTHQDIVDPELERQKTLVGRAVAYMIEADEDDPEAIRKSMQKAKNILLKMFTTGRDLMKFDDKNQIPVFSIEDEVMEVFKKKIDDDDGYFRRFIEMKRESPLEEAFLSAVPTLVLLAEAEQDVLVPSSPTYNIFNDINRLRKVFPNGKVETVYSKTEKRKVTHSDLVFQADRFAEHLDHWLSRTIG